MFNDRSILAVSSSGLSNRLHLFASVLRIGPILSRNVRFYWPKTEQLPIDFKELFKNNWPVIDERELDNSFFRTECSVKAYNVGERVRIDDKENIIFVKSWNEVRLDKDDDWVFLEEQSILRSLEPVEPVRERAGQLLASNRPFVGIHIRTCDMVGLHILKNPEGTITRAHEVYAKGPHEHIKAAREAINKGYNIFVCSDDVECEKAVEKAFPGRVYRQVKGTEWRTTVGGMIEALVDLYALAKCELILGTKGSQFSRIAASIGGIPIFYPGSDEVSFKLS